MKKILTILILTMLTACSSLHSHKQPKVKFTIKSQWNINTKDVYLNSKHIKNSEEYVVEEGVYKLSWKYKKLNTSSHEKSMYNYFWTYQMITVDSNTYISINGNNLEIKKGA